MSFVKRHPLLIFFLLAYLLSWYPWLLHLAGVTRGEGGLNPLGPLVAALVLSAITGGWKSVKRLLRRIVEWRGGVGHATPNARHQRAPGVLVIRGTLSCASVACRC